jgi:hypothetical protein
MLGVLFIGKKTVARGLYLYEQHEAESFQLLETRRIEKMKKFRNMLATVSVISIFACSTAFADGILVAGLSGNTGTTKGEAPCTETTVKVDSGILVAGFTGILVAGFTGILVAGATDGGEVVNCGILVAG